MSKECEQLRSALLTALKNSLMISVVEDITCYRSDGLYVVDYWPSEGVTDVFGLTDNQQKQLEEEDELSEYFEDPESAVDFFLTLRESNQNVANRALNIKTRKTMQETLSGEDK